MIIKHSKALTDAIRKLSHVELETTQKHMQDDLGMAYATVGNLIRVGAINLEFSDAGTLSGTESDIDFAVQEIYRTIRIQRAICARFEAPDRPILTIEQNESGY